MANRDLNDVTNIAESNLFDTDVSVILSQAGIWRDVASVVLRNALSKALFKSAARPPTDDDRVAGQSAAFWDSENSKFYLSFEGSGWLLISTGGDTSNLQVGVHTHLGNWEHTQGSPGSGDYFVGANELRISVTNSNDEDKSSELSRLDAGDRFQVGEINTFDITSAELVEASPASYRFTGTWIHAYSYFDFAGNSGQQQSADIYFIKRKNVLGQNAPRLNSVLRLTDDFSLHWVYTPYEQIWSAASGRIVSTGSTTYTLLPNKRFSDYRDISIIYDNQDSSRVAVAGANELSVTFPAGKFVSGNFLQVHTMAYWKQLNIVSDTSFRIAQGISTHLGIREIWGGR
ncbi:hypothetical protein F4Y93_06025 [Candidatus Poribacteria bacterium]|nr:hypothetical protein [Candidatus Poribacteria bacterium]